jgi:hypothetical protein
MASTGEIMTIARGEFSFAEWPMRFGSEKKHGSDGLHAIGVQSVRASTSRTVSGAGGATDFFYNPMWRTYGHQQHQEAGAATHYWIRAWAHELGWFMLDQVVLRPEESGRFPESQLRIITQVGAISLLDAEGLPDAQTASDHLPIVFHWNL